MAETLRPEPIRILRQAGEIAVYEAKGPGGAAMVVKWLQRDPDNSDPIGRKRFAREKHLASVLAHPGLPASPAHGEDWIGFEKLGASLADAGNGPADVSPADIRRLLADLADALAYFHAFGIVHADIKPAQILFRGDQPVLIDFGIASIGSDEPEFAGELAGTPAWMAPEQLTSTHRTPAIDIWSLCATMLFSLTRTRPYEGTADEVLARRQRGEPPAFTISASLRDSDPELFEILERGMAAPEQRPTAAAIVRNLRGSQAK